MAMWANVIKVVQFASIAALVDYGEVAARLADPATAAAGLALAAFGQHLNAAVYVALGMDGVYYGNRFGKKIPWVRSYPYSVWADMHPQYLGCLASLAGAAVLGVPQEVALWWASNYLYLMWLESRNPSIISVVS
jgi:methylene-fatty-acyl-phospholipid synthase